MKRSTDSLRPHPENDRIYGDEPDAELIESVRAKGVISPLLIASDGRIISGHRRWRSAQACGLVEVPVAVFGSDDELDILEALIHANRQRSRTNVMLAREAKVLMEIETERAKRRQQEAAARAGQASGAARRAESNVRETFPGRSEERARDKVGAALGVSGRTVEKAVQVLEKVEQLRGDGQVKEAERIAAKLEQSVEAAHKEVRAATAPAPALPRGRSEPSLVPPSLLAAARRFDAVRSAAQKLRAEIYDLAEMPGGEFLRKQSGSRGGKPHLACIEDVLAVLKGNRPQLAGCPTCDGTSQACIFCQGSGYLPHRIAKQLSDEQKAGLPQVRDD